MVRLVGHLGVSSGNIVGSLPLSLESDGLLVPVIDGGGDSVHRHNLTHQCRWNSYREISNQNVGVRDIGKGNMVFECRDIFYE